ncbi:Stk1 family PASTA domain-containing Ser/Thr kinase [soil metagenome]
MADPSRLLASRYALGAVIGYGGMAEVHLAHDVRLGRDVAVKILRQDLARDTQFQVRFRREALASASLNHPAIVAVFDTGEDQGPDGTTPFIVMEFVEGQTLREMLKNDGALPTPRAVAVCVEICAALDFSHRNGIVHRDVKPGNVMVAPDGSIKVMDFGIARAVSDSSATMTSTAAVIGTAQYLSPEQARGESVDARSDVYSCGCLLYELLAGSPPFTGDSPVAVAYQHVREDPIPPSQLNPAVSPAMDAVVIKAMSKNPANRYQSAADMRADLLRIQEGLPVEATPLMSDEDKTNVIGGVPAAPGVARYRPAGLSDIAAAEARERRRSRLGYLLLALALIGLVVAAVLVVPRLAAEPEPQRVAVPDLTGLTEEQAELRLQTVGLGVGDVTQDESSPEEENTVIDQDPAVGDVRSPGEDVDFVIGAGPATVLVPQIIGLTEDAARAQLEAEGLLIAPVQERNSVEPAGRVVDSTPRPGETVAEGSEVTLFISTGTLPLPSVVGETCESGTAILDQAGFTNVVCVPLQTSDGAPGTVIGQDPAAGDVTPTNRITLTYAVEPPPPPTTSAAPPTTTTPPTTTIPPTTTTPPTTSTPPTTTEPPPYGG